MKYPLRNIDLNLLVSLQVLLEEQNVSKAAKQLGISQSAMSRTLARLRELMNDPLFIRASKGLIPTPRAEEIRVQLLDTLQSVDKIIKQPNFSPATATGTIKIATMDFASFPILSDIYIKLHSMAPQIQIEVVNWTVHTLKELEQNSIDIAIGVLFNSPLGIYQTHLFQDHLVGIVRKDHPILSSDLALNDYLGYQHILTMVIGAGKGLIDMGIENKGLRRQVAIKVPNFSTSFDITSKSDLILTAPSILAQTYKAHGKIAYFELPFQAQLLNFSLVWHERRKFDSMHQWLRSTLKSELNRINFKDGPFWIPQV
ncbi:MAG: LysR family transcriptional regulator [SAR324 cluster bacterium]|nr:LysR family transcriptional regulator [SAR324 cluster bacterium]